MLGLRKSTAKVEEAEKKNQEETITLLTNELSALQSDHSEVAMHLLTQDLIESYLSGYPLCNP